MSEELAKRAVACARWRWMPGMRAVSLSGKHWRVWSDTRSVYEPEGCMDSAPAEWSKDVPDLTDPATVGCLLALVREVAQEPGLHVRCMLPYAPDMGGKTPPPWVLHSGRGQRLGDRYETEAEALVAALEAAP